MDGSSVTLEWSAAERRVLLSKGLQPEQCRKTDEQNLSHYLAFTLAAPPSPTLVTEALATAQRAVDAGTPDPIFSHDASFAAGLSFAHTLSPIVGGGASSSSGNRGINLNASLDLSGVDTSDKAVAQKVARYVNDAAVSRANAQASKDPAIKPFTDTVMRA